jgi:DNA-binding beta-propeller fold protein YncE
VPFSLEASTTPIRFDSIYTTPELQALYVLDKENSRLVKFSKEGNILAQFQNETLKDGTSLAINETTNTAYITTTTSLISVSLQ